MYVQDCDLNHFYFNSCLHWKIFCWGVISGFCWNIALKYLFEPFPLRDFSSALWLVKIGLRVVKNWLQCTKIIPVDCWEIRRFSRFWERPPHFGAISHFFLVYFYAHKHESRRKMNESSRRKRPTEIDKVITASGWGNQLDWDGF